MRHFEILKIELSPGGPGPERLYQVWYRAYRNKKWVESSVWQIARTEKQAKERAQLRFGS
jgi:hypothetical protein